MPIAATNGSRRYSRPMANSLRRWDAAFERRLESLIPRGWRVNGPSAGAGLIGAGLAYIVVGPLLLVRSPRQIARWFGTLERAV